MATPTVSRDKDELDEIYQALRRGMGREKVTDENALALADRADREGHAVLAQELREWQAPCGAPEHQPDGSGRGTAPGARLT